MLFKLKINKIGENIKTKNLKTAFEKIKQKRRCQKKYFS
jgi:hypothetical protein